MERINVAELLKDCPSGMELDCTLFSNVIFNYVAKEGIWINYFDSKGHENEIYLDCEGCLPLPSLNSVTDKCIIFPKGKTTWEGFHRPFKDGDIVFYNNCVSIFKEWANESLFVNYVKVDIAGKRPRLYDRTCSYGKNIREEARFATEEEKEKLFQEIKDSGCLWNPNDKTLKHLPKFTVGDRIILKDNPHNLPSVRIKAVTKSQYILENEGFLYIGSTDEKYVLEDKFDINVLKPFESRVLVRNSNTEKWKSNFWGFYNSDNTMNHPYECCGASFSQCIPYEGNEHLLSKVDDCDEYFKTWIG